MPHGATQDLAARPEAAVMAALGRRSIVLVGMMGAGKSSIGRRVAIRLGIPFVDADAEIEKAKALMEERERICIEHATARGHMQAPEDSGCQ